MYKILENLASYGLGEPSELSGYVDCEIGLIDDFRIIDVRVLPEFDAPASPSEYSGTGQFNGPGGVAVDSAGNVYVSDIVNNRIQEFSR